MPAGFCSGVGNIWASALVWVAAGADAFRYTIFAKERKCAISVCRVSLVLLFIKYCSICGAVSFAAWLTKHNVKFLQGKGTRSSADLPAEMTTNLLNMPKGKMFIVNEGGKSMIVSVVNIKEAPVTAKDRSADRRKPRSAGAGAAIAVARRRKHHFR